MPFDFPSSPSEGQIFNAPGGPTYVYNNPAWKAVGQGQIAVIADGPPVSPANGTLWFESDTGNLFVYYNDGSSSQWVQVSGSAQAALTAETRNRVVNPAMQISQENSNTAGTVNNYYAADQWAVTQTTSGTITKQRVQSVTPNGSKDRFRVTITVADATLAANDTLYVWTAIEGGRVADFRYGSASARQSILRFGWKSPAGTYSISIQNNAADRSYVANFTVAAGQANTDTIQTFIIPGDVTGTWLTDTSAGLWLYVVLASGSGQLGSTGWQAAGGYATSSNTNGMATVGAVFELFDVGLYLDPLATGIAPPWTMPDEAEELRACRRYYANYTAYTGVSGIATAGSQTAWATYALPVAVRNTPAVTFSGYTNSNINTGTVLNTAGTDGIRMHCVSAAAGLFYSFVSNIIANARM